jgi:hypothetical protein
MQSEPLSFEYIAAMKFETNLSALIKRVLISRLTELSLPYSFSTYLYFFQELLYYKSFQLVVSTEDTILLGLSENIIVLSDTSLNEV